MSEQQTAIFDQVKKRHFFAIFLRMFMKRKKTAITIVILIGAGIGWYAYAKNSVGSGENTYVLAAATKGSVIVTVTGSGQVSGENQLNVVPKVSSTLQKYLVNQGDRVTAGTAIARLDPTDGNRSVRDAAQGVQNARLSVASAQLNLKKLQAPPDAYALLQAQNAVDSANRALTTLMQGADSNSIASAKADVQQQLDALKMASDGITPQSVRDAYDDATLNLKSAIRTINDALTSCDAVVGVDSPMSNDSFKDQFLSQKALGDATIAYQTTKAEYVAIKKIVDALPTTGADMKMIDGALLDMIDALSSAQNLGTQTYTLTQSIIPSATFTSANITTLQTSVKSVSANAATAQSQMISSQRAITTAGQSYQNALLNITKSQASLNTLLSEPKPEDVAAAKEKIAEAQAALDKLKAGPTALDTQSQQQSIQQQQASLTAAQSKLSDAQTDLKNYTVLMPFDGLVATLPLKPGDPSSGSTALATIISDDMVANVTLNEVDLVNVKIGQKATLAFDAISDLSIAGQVAEINPIGTTSQGVVSYTVKIVFKTQDTRIKSGMSVSADIITKSSIDVLTVPNSAIRSVNGASTVSVLTGVMAQGAALTTGVASPTSPKTVQVEIGLADSSNTEIISGLNEGDVVVVKTITPAQQKASVSTSKTTTKSTSNVLRAVSGGGGFSGGPPGN
ncbi:MAG: HlyD family efflux transporter periplasmic adaptor subunit [Patescibacteria group bacterium]